MKVLITDLDKIVTFLNYKTLKRSNRLNFEFCNYNEILRKPQNLTQKKRIK